jgi:hypothetical protein
MAEIIQFPSDKLREWQQIEKIIGNNTKLAGISERDRQYLIDRIKSIFDDLPYPDHAITLDLSELQDLSNRDKAAVIRLAQNVADSVLARFQPLTGSALGVIFDLVLQLWRIEGREDG